MERDHKYSGTLPLLAYAPQDFGHNGQRSRAYRARAAMGRTDVQSLRSHAQASATGNKPVATELARPQKSSFLFSLWRRVSGLFGKSGSMQPAAQPTVALDAVLRESSVSQPQILNRKVSENRIVSERIVQAEYIPEKMPEQANIAEADVVQSQAVSKTYAAMRLNNVGVTADDRSIPQAPDLAHALAEIRAALREHERLAKAHKGDNNLM